MLGCLLSRGPWRLPSDIQILDAARLKFVHPPMDPDVFLIRPGALDDVSVDDILDLPLHRLADLVSGRTYDERVVVH